LVMIFLFMPIAKLISKRWSDFTSKPKKSSLVPNEKNVESISM
jgi:hypothetical protein